MNRLRFSLLCLITAAWLYSAGDAAFAQTNEDFIQQEAIQRSLASGLVKETIFGRNEPAAIHFHTAMRELSTRAICPAPTPSVCSPRQ